MDFGNSRVKVWQSPKFEFTAFDYGGDWFRRINLNKNKIYYSSVNDAESERAKAYFKNIDWNDAFNLLGDYSGLDFSEISGMGTDRKLGLIATDIKYNLPAITIDSGTAITINVVGENKECLGGFIFPGLETQAKLLSEYGSGLPLVEICQEADEYRLGKDTEGAISLGILNGMVGSVEYHLDNIMKTYFSNYDEVNIILTGGNSEFLLNILNKSEKLINCKIIHDNNLVFLGLKHIAQSHWVTNKA